MISEHDPNWRGLVLVWDEQAIFLGHAADASLHESPAIKVCVALDGNFSLRTGDADEWIDYDSAIIAPGQPHAIDGRQNRIVMFLLAPETPLAQPLAPIFSQNGITKIHSGAVEKIRTIFASFDQTRAGDEPNVCHQMVGAIGSGDSLPIDSRVAQSIEWIRSSREEGISVQEIASGVELSESRFSHLFTENVRIPVRRYLLWLRLRDAMHLLAQGRSLTETAHEAGFSDSAHLARTFRSLLGIAPSALTKESTIKSFLR
ncbi:MAG TPA: AraC family transcriptional regulator [Pyrinomonadaceae bacterium]|nr:AraC family transcriptional regulator [Pyrinomonadaceae bacterium]